MRGGPGGAATGGKCGGWNRCGRRNGRRGFHGGQNNRRALPRANGSRRPQHDRQRDRGNGGEHEKIGELFGGWRLGHDATTLGAVRRDFLKNPRASGCTPWHVIVVTFPPLLASLHALAFYVAAGITSFGWALCALVGWDARPWVPLWFCGALLIYNVDRLRRDPADAVNVPRRTATIERLRPVCAGLASIAAAVLIALPLLRRDWMTLALVLAGTVGCLSYSIPLFGVPLKSVPLLKTFFAPTVLLCAIVVPPWLREGAPADVAPACIALAWAWCFLEFNMILCDLRDIEGDRRCGIASLPVLLGSGRTRFVLASLIFFTTALALVNVAFDPRNASDWMALGAFGALMLTMIFVESRVRRSEQFYEWLVEGMIFFPAFVFAVVPSF